MKLIQNELIKIFNKKSTYIFIFIIFLYVLYTNYFYRYKTTYNINDLLTNFFLEYELIIFIFITYISSNIITNEFKGTINNLLILPYKRNEILISKYLTCIIMLLFITIYIFILQLIIGRLFFSFNSLTPILIGIKKVNIFIYLLQVLITKLPIFLMNIIIAILISLITLNTSITNVTILINYMFITPLINTNTFKIFKYFINNNWDFSNYLYSNIPYKSIIIYLLYLIVILVINHYIFNNKDIKTN